MLSSLLDGRHGFAQRAWKEAYASFSAADAHTPLEGHDLERLATAAYLTGNDEVSERAWTRAYEWLRPRDRRRAARCVFWLTLQLLAVGDWARASGWLSTAERLLDEDEECPERGLLLVLVGRTHAKYGDLEAAFETFTRVDALARRSDDLELNAFRLLAFGLVAASRGDRAAATKLFDEAMVAVTADGLSPISTAVIYCAVIEACHEIFDIARAREWTAALSRWCAEQPDLVPFRGHCLVHRAEILRLTGDWATALSEVSQVCAVAGEPAADVSPLHYRRRAYPIAAAFYEVAEIHRLRGACREADEAYRQANAYGRSPDPGLALLRLAQGHADAAESAIRRLHGHSQRPVVRTAVLAAYVEIALAVQDLSAAWDAAGELAELAETLSMPYVRALSAQARGQVLLAGGRPREAIDALRTAWTEWQALEVPYEAARARAAMGIGWRQLGDAEAADLEFDAAHRVFRRLGASLDAVRVPGPLSTSPPGAVPPLTPREQQVIRSIAAGKTNREIAAELAISERTVDRHVSNILTKLDLPSRSAATAYAYEHRLVRPDTSARDPVRHS